ncbi:DUF58 domain-containing protein [Mangrovimicrobium sediminis]|uniref:DUF58 domain-containing protein n=1 Tax=Mangrovimicrobium sediminis TaxID=2562682 RepID=A0A4Z0M8H2_9GAMM|nr:DUF58 domain-containing protein [Haliea sp. SAOS-164]TGD75819.1 DUF58 domain-containing protein [Haliea sp. SAOS-164]
MKPGPAGLRALWWLLGLGLAVAALRLLQWPGAALAGPLWLAAAAGLAGAALVDAWRVLREAPVSCARQLPRSLALGRRNRIGIALANPGGRRVSGLAVDHYPEHLAVHDLPRPFSLPAGGELEFDYQVEPTRRGELHFTATELLIDSPWQLWRRRVQREDNAALRVYPDFFAAGNLREISAEERARMLGIHLQRRRGEGTDFLQLREFREGDILRQVDWKASSRLCKLVSREYQDEHDRDIIFLLDCGRRMHGRDGHLSHFDHALNSILLTAWFALREGDGVGVCTFAGRELWLEPGKHRHGINPLLDGLYDLQATTQGTDFIEATQRLCARRSKRALVILVTNVQAEDAEDLRSATRILGERHAVVLANLRERELEERATAPIEHFEDALAHSVAVDILRERQRVIRQLRETGTWVVDCLPHQLSQSLAGQYLALKRSGAV